MNRTYADFAVEKTVELLAIDSPSGYTDAAAEWVRDTFASLGYDAKITTKGGVLIDLGGTDTEDALFLEAHADTLGAMVSEIKGSGRLKVTNLGGMRAENSEAENVRVHTRDGKVIEGTLQLCNASVHVNLSYGDTKRTWNAMEVVLDEDVHSAADTRALGIEVGDIVAFDPRTIVTKTGYIQEPFPRRQAVRRHPARSGKVYGGRKDHARTPGLRARDRLRRSRPRRFGIRSGRRDRSDLR